MSLFPPLPDKKYSIIYADPPWQYGRPMSPKSSGVSLEDMSHYQTLSLNELETLAVDQLAGSDCLLYLWVTGPLMADGITLAKTWGFNYKQVAFVWQKQNKVLGHYSLTSCEFVLVFKKIGGRIPEGNGVAGVEQFLSIKATEHSVKPGEVRRRIHKMFPDVNKVELFARSDEMRGWDYWGRGVDTLKPMSDNKAPEVDRAVEGMAVEPYVGDGIWRDAELRFDLKTDEDFEQAMGVLVSNKQAADRLKATEDELCKPLKAVIKNIKQRIDFYREPIEQIVVLSKKAVAQYKEDQAHKLATELARARDNPDTMKPILMEMAKTTYPASGGRVTFRELIDFEVTDWRKVPVDCLEINGAEVRKLAKIKDKIPGIQLKQKKSVAVTLLERDSHGQWV